MNTFVVANPNKCIGCRACEIACAIAHLDTTVVTAGATEVPFLPRLNLIRTSRVTMPIQCRQCDDAPCANVCPVEAITQKDNTIIVNTKRCIGCKTCMLACPFGAMDMVPEWEKGEPLKQAALKVENAEGEEEIKEVLIAHKCDLCAGREKGPACKEVCPAEAFVTVNPTLSKANICEKRISSALEFARTKR
ncbi:4Fe-4S dicluster domain-containing protein [Sporomusa sp.]|uniref:4Fe-4S dicluster domain-containing protein n=1 Tax=Sporomusa sp. TaxID=2078658 RepID=UPI002D1B07AD|nr:4Fe-4S dicluster domain-containing protein [Sporomusa sp.]HWR41780.1 4Fe-4S dicluster domain-containing protein [Sporomusa sp.]